MKQNKLMQLLRDNVRAQAPAKLRADATADGVSIYVNDVIDSDWGASSAALIPALASAGSAPVHLHINSPGGDVFEARAMAAAIVAHPGKVVAHIDGMCASAATYVALACNEVHMTDGGLFMVHNSWTMAMGNASDLIETAALLEKIDGTIRADYVRKTGATLAQVTEWMDATTWFTAEEAKAAGFVDVIDPNTKQDGEKPAARWNLAAYPNAPKLDAPRADAGQLSAPLDDADRTYLGAMAANYSQAVELSKNLILANGATPLRGFAEEVIDEQAGDLEIVKLWIAASPAAEYDDPEDLTRMAVNQIQINRNRLRLIAGI